MHTGTEFNKSEAEPVTASAFAVKYAVILAAGEGRRAGGGVPKQFRELNGYPMFWWSVMAFHRQNPEVKILLVLHPGYFDDWDIFFESLPEDERIEVKVVCGGRSRLESVSNALMSVPDKEDVYVAVHDAARPLVSEAMIGRGWECGEKTGACVPAVALTDSIRRLTPDGSVAVSREDFVGVQTPQVFRSSLLHKAYSAPLDARFTDDASVVEATGVKVALYPGDPLNMKVTNPLDIDVAALLMNHRASED